MLGPVLARKARSMKPGGAQYRSVVSLVINSDHNSMARKSPSRLELRKQAEAVEAQGGDEPKKKATKKAAAPRASKRTRKRPSPANGSCGWSSTAA